jgi:hypothetical protein
VRPGSRINGDPLIAAMSTTPLLADAEIATVAAC